MIAVFLGPSLPVEQARTILDAFYLPPVAGGDVYALVEHRPTAICIVDGFFERVPSVFHKEIMYALAEGIPVYGSSSMGALRAAELEIFGMVGVGQVFEFFRDGEEDDDEVAVAHAAAEFGYRSLSDAMVNIRYGLKQAVTAGVISREKADHLTATAKAMFYEARSWATLCRDEPELQDFVARTKPDAKRDDALALLELMRREPPQPHVPSFAFPRTPAWQMMVKSDGPGRAERMARLLNAR